MKYGITFLGDDIQIFAKEMKLINENTNIKENKTYKRSSKIGEIFKIFKGCDKK